MFGRNSGDFVTTNFTTKLKRQKTEKDHKLSEAALFGHCGDGDQCGDGG